MLILYLTYPKIIKDMEWLIYHSEIFIGKKSSYLWKNYTVEPKKTDNILTFLSFLRIK